MKKIQCCVLSPQGHLNLVLPNIRDSEHWQQSNIQSKGKIFPAKVRSAIECDGRIKSMLDMHGPLNQHSLSRHHSQSAKGGGGQKRLYGIQDTKWQWQSVAWVKQSKRKLEGNSLELDTQSIFIWARINNRIIFPTLSVQPCCSAKVNDSHITIKWKILASILLKLSYLVNGQKGTRMICTYRTEKCIWYSC